ncbi:hypothetical protein OTU49_014945, partial [Cherax quadricarinatus]
MRRMDKSREGERGEKSRGGLPPGMDPATAALYAPWLHQEQALLSAWWNIAGLQQMELLSRLQGGLGGSSGQAGAAAAVAAAAGGLGGYGGLHPEHLMNLEILQAQHAAAMAAALSTSKSSSSSSKSSKSSKSVSSSSSSNGKGITSTLSYRGSPATTTTTYSSRAQEPSSNSSRASLEISRLASSSHSSSSNSSRPPSYPYSTSSHRYSSPLSGLESVSSHHSDLGSSPNLSYGIATLIADKHPSHHKSHSSSSSVNSSSTQAERVAEKLASNGSVSISKAIRNKELEIIPISPAGKGSSQSHGSAPPHRDKSEPKVSISTVGSGNSRLSNGVPSSAAWREESASVSIEPCGSGTPTSADDAPLNLSMKAPSLKPSSKGVDKRELKESHPSSLSLSRSGVPPFDFPQNLSGGLGSGLTPSLEVLQSLYGQPGEPRDVLASMQEALQRQLLGTDGKRDEKKKRMEDAQERARHLGRGVSKPKKNTVASLLEQCRAAGIKPSSLPLPPTTSIAATPVTTSPPLHVACPRTGESLSITSTSPTFNSSSSSSPSPASQSLPPTLIPGLPANLPSSLSASIGSPAPPPPIPTPPVPSLSISAVTTSPAISTEPTTITTSSTTSTSSVVSTPM